MTAKITSGDSVLEAVKAFPESTANELATLLDATPDVIKSALRRLEAKNLVTRGTKRIEQPKGKRGRSNFICYSAGSAPTKRSKPPKVAKPTEASSEPQGIDALLKELEELREFKRLALMSYPDLDITPVIYEARKMLAKHFPDQKQKDEILSGKMDKRPPMLAVIEVLENGA